MGTQDFAFLGTNFPSYLRNRAVSIGYTLLSKLVILESVTIRPEPNATEIVRAALGKMLLAITNPFGASAQGYARCSYSCARAVASGEPAESPRAGPPVPGRYSGPGFRRRNATPALPSQYKG